VILPVNPLVNPRLKAREGLLIERSVLISALDRRRPDAVKKLHRIRQISAEISAIRAGKRVIFQDL
jgi:hypothetical protein